MIIPGIKIRHDQLDVFAKERVLGTKPTGADVADVSKAFFMAPYGNHTYRDYSIPSAYSGLAPKATVEVVMWPCGEDGGCIVA